jgi:hypothetical protein
VLRKKHADGAAQLCDRRMMPALEGGHINVHNQLVILTGGSPDMSRSNRRHMIARRPNTTRALRLSGAAFAPHELTAADLVLIPTAELSATSTQINAMNGDREAID